MFLHWGPVGTKKSHLIPKGKTVPLGGGSRGEVQSFLIVVSEAGMEDSAPVITGGLTMV